MGEKAKILVVDDEAVVRESYLRSLAGVSYRVRAALDAEEAIRLMETEPFDVVLVDIRMPGMDGISLLREIKTRWPESEVVVVTGYPTLESAKEAVRLGAHNYLTKPIGPREIVEAASGALLQKRWSLKKDYSSDSRSGGKRFEYRYPWEN
jgi:DNA-binding NtrC family response regulator